MQINKEEELFKWTPTTYPQLEQVQSSLEPFMHLFSTVSKWQKAEKKLMDGTFLEIDAEDTQAKVCVCVCVGGGGVKVCVWEGRGVKVCIGRWVKIH